MCHGSCCRFCCALAYCFLSDPDGDCVAFSSDEELCGALGFVTDGVFKIYVRTKGMSKNIVHM